MVQQTTLQLRRAVTDHRGSPPVGVDQLRRILLQSLTALVLGAPFTASATVVEPAGPAALADEARRVVRARVVAQNVQPQRGPRGEIYTRTELRVLEDYKGTGPRTLVVQQLGGTLGEITMRVGGDARFVVGAEVVVTLDWDPQRRLAFVVGLAQGLWQVDRTGAMAVVQQDLSGLAFYGPESLRPRRISAAAVRPRVTLEALRRQLVRTRPTSVEGVLR